MSKVILSPPARRAGTVGSGEAAAGPRSRIRWDVLARRHLLPLALYLLITAVVTFPLVLHLGTHLPGDGRDAWMNYWNFWWTREALAAGGNPLRTPLLYAP